jgi:transposase
MEAKMEQLKAHEAEVDAHPDKQVSLTDPDARSMNKAGGGSTVGYNVQTVVDSKHHLIATHEVTNEPSDRSQLSSMAGQAAAALDTKALTVIADPGYYKGEEIVDCYAAGIKALVPKVDTTGRKAKGQYSKADFRYDAQHNEYICPAGQRLTYRFDSVEQGKTQWVYETNHCTSCSLQTKCTTSNAKRIKRWEKEDILDAADALLQQNPDAMRQRKRLVEHPYGTIKHWMGSTHFLMKRLPNVQAEMSLHVLAYNLKRAINVLGVAKIMEQLQSA